MNGGPDRAADDRLAELENAVRALESRLAAIEARHAPPEDLKLGVVIDALTPAVPAPTLDIATALAFVGRSLVVLGGAYLLRAVTDATVWTPGVGVALGFAYAAWWLAVAGRTGHASGVFHGATAALIAYPLLYEAATRFHVLAPAAAAAALGAATLASLAVAAGARIQTLAWFAIAGALPTSLALTAATGAVLPFALADTALGILTLWIGYTIDWVWLRWPVAIVADLAVLALPAALAAHTAPTTPAEIIAAQLLLPGGYLVSVVVRTLVRGRDVNVFEALQSVAALAVGFGGAAWVARGTGTTAGILVVIALATGIAAYAVAFAFVKRRQGAHLNFFFYTSLGLALVLAGSALGLPEPAMWWSAVAVACAAIAGAAPAILTIHSAVYLMAAAIASGLLEAAARAFGGAPAAQPLLAPRFLAVFAAACTCWAIRPTLAGPSAAARVTAGARAAIALLVTLSASAWIVALGLADGTVPGIAATVRTASLAVTVLALAWLGRGTRLREAAWLVYPLLAVGAIKLIVEDFPASTAATLFVALATYGGALIAAPRLARKKR